MRKIHIIIGLTLALATAAHSHGQTQPPSIKIVYSDPTGVACSQSLPNEQYQGTMFTCKGGVWTASGTVSSVTANGANGAASISSGVLNIPQGQFQGNKMGSGPSLTAPIFSDGGLTDRFFFRLNGNYEWDTISGTPVFSFGNWHATSTEVQMVHAFNYGFDIPTYTIQGVLKFTTTGTGNWIGVTNTGTGAGVAPVAAWHGVGFTPANGFTYYNGSTLTSLSAAANFTNGGLYVVTMISINQVGWASVCPLGNTSGCKTFSLAGTMPNSNNFLADSQSSGDVQFGLRYSSGEITFNSLRASQIDVPASDITYNVSWATMLTVPSNPVGGNNNIYVIIPPNYRPGGQYPWVLYVTGHGQPGCAIFGCATGGPWPNQGSLINYLTTAGYVVVAMDYTSLTNWGNANSNLDTAALAAQWPMWFNLSGQPYVIMESMGGLTALNSVFHGKLKPRAIVGLYPAYSLSSMYANGAGTFASEIQTAYGFAGPSGYAAATAGYDPALDAISTFVGIPVDIWCSASDTTVPCATNGQALASAITAAGGDATFNASSGNHGDASNFDPVAVINFFNSH